MQQSNADGAMARRTEDAIEPPTNVILNAHDPGTVVEHVHAAVVALNFAGFQRRLSLMIN